MPLAEFKYRLSSGNVIASMTVDENQTPESMHNEILGKAVQEIEIETRRRRKRSREIEMMI